MMIAVSLYFTFRIGDVGVARDDYRFWSEATIFALRLGWESIL
jgi:hypothetical protein